MRHSFIQLFIELEKQLMEKIDQHLEEHRNKEVEKDKNIEIELRKRLLLAKQIRKNHTERRTNMG